MIRLPARVVRFGFVTVAFLSLVFAVTGCGGGNDGQSSPPVAGSCNVKYEITGNDGGALSVAYLAESNATVGAGILPLPWSKSVTFPRGVATTASTGLLSLPSLAYVRS